MSRRLPPKPELPPEHDVVKHILMGTLFAAFAGVALVVTVAYLLSLIPTA